MTRFWVFLCPQILWGFASAHLYATTVDITYRRFEGTDLVNADIYKYIMAEVLRDLRKEGRCYVKFELKQACYHITVR